MKVIGVCCLHYGKEYLAAAIQAVSGVCDEIIISYVESPSYGHGTDVKCPETRNELMHEAIRSSEGRVIFVPGEYSSEGEHRGAAYKMAKDRNADMICIFDADEIWDPESLKQAIEKAKDIPAKYIGIGGYVNFWRSFNDACYDSFTPIRLINVNHPEENESVVGATIYHFSCAQSEAVMRYKYLIHGHFDEIRPGWLENTYFKWQRGQNDLHPTNIGLWNATPFDKNTLPEILKSHPNFHKKVI